MHRLSILLLAFLGFSTACLAGPPTGGSNPENPTISVDKSGYDLFNPVPEDQLRKLIERPDTSKSPYTLDAGHFQYKTDLVDYGYNHNGPQPYATSKTSLASTTLKMGMTNDTDLELAEAPINFSSRKSKTSGATQDFHGIGDLYIRVKYNIFGNDGGNYALGVMPYVKAPTAAKGIGNDHWEGGVYLPTVVALPDNWDMLVETEYDQLENQRLDGTHSNYINIVDFSHPLIEDVRGFFELSEDSNNDPHAPTTQYHLTLSASWRVAYNMKLSLGTSIGLNNQAQQLAPFATISQRF